MKRPAIKRSAGLVAPKTPLVRLLTAITYTGLYGGLLMPLVFSETLTVSPFVFLKLLVFQTWIGLTIPAFLVLALLEPRFRPRRSWVTIALVAHLAALGLSVVFALDRARAFWGNQERMGGFFSSLHFFAWFLIATAVLRTWAQWRRLLVWQVMLGFVMAAVALITLPYPMFLGLQADIRISGLLGNPIFSAGYHLFILFFLALLWTHRNPGAKGWPFAVAAAASLGALILAGSRGPLLGLLAGALVTALVWTTALRRFRALGTIAFALASSTGLYTLIARVAVPHPALTAFWEKFSSLKHLFAVDFDPTRRRLWSTAWEGFLARPWTGWGLGNYESLYDVFYRPISLCLGREEALQDSAHSLVFDHLGQTGAVGTVTFALVWGAGFVAFVRALRQRRLDIPASALLLGLTTANLVQGLFIFDSPALLSLSFLLLALAAAVEHRDFTLATPAVTLQATLPGPTGRWALPALLVLQTLAALLVARTSILPGRASNLMQQAHAAYQRGSCADMLTLAQAAFATPTPYLDDQLYLLVIDLGDLAQKGSFERCGQWRELLAHERKVAEAVLQDHPEHARQRLIHANFLVAFGLASQDPSLWAEAGPHFDALVAESPNRQMYLFSRGHWFGDQGRVQEAQADFERALALEEVIGESRWRLGFFRWSLLNQAQQGATLMARAMTGPCAYTLRSALEVQLLAQAWTLLGDKEHLRDIVKHVRDLPKGDRPGAVHLVVARYLEDLALLRERDEVLALAFERDASVRSLLLPLREGRVRTLAEADDLLSKAKAGADNPRQPR